MAYGDNELQSTKQIGPTLPLIDPLAPNNASKPGIVVEGHSFVGILGQQDEANRKVTGKHLQVLSGNSESLATLNSVTGNITSESGKIHQPKKQRTHASTASDELVPDSEEPKANKNINKIKGQLIETSDYSCC